jgi:hypothetical protein
MTSNAKFINIASNKRYEVVKSNNGPSLETPNFLLVSFGLLHLYQPKFCYTQIL